MMITVKRATLPVTLALLLTACGGDQEAGNAVADDTAKEAGHGEAEGEHKGEIAEGAIVLTPRQITAAGIAIVRPSVTGGGGVLTLPATIEGDPQGTQVVSAAIGGSYRSPVTLGSRSVAVRCWRSSRAAKRHP